MVLKNSWARELIIFYPFYKINGYKQEDIIKITCKWPISCTLLMWPLIYGTLSFSHDHVRFFRMLSSIICMSRTYNNKKYFLGVQKFFKIIIVKEKELKCSHRNKLMPTCITVYGNFFNEWNDFNCQQVHNMRFF